MQATFPGQARIHLGLTVSDLERSIAFYTSLLRAEPTKVRAGYAKFETAEPSVNLALNEDPGSVRPLPAHTHFGIQVHTTETVMEAKTRLEAAGLATKLEEQVTCCYAVQDKFWVQDPDGHAWEVFVVTQADSALRSEPHAGPTTNAESEACCEPSCCA